MHLHPHPYGHALALVPRREAQNLRRKNEVRPLLRNAIRPRERYLEDVRYFNSTRGHI